MSSLSGARFPRAAGPASGCSQCISSTTGSRRAHGVGAGYVARRRHPTWPPERGDDPANEILPDALRGQAGPLLFVATLGRLGGPWPGRRGRLRPCGGRVRGTRPVLHRSPPARPPRGVGQRIRPGVGTLGLDGQSAEDRGGGGSGPAGSPVREPSARGRRHGRSRDRRPRPRPPGGSNLDAPPRFAKPTASSNSASHWTLFRSVRRLCGRSGRR
jgi:hypothetical protein